MVIEATVSYKGETVAVKPKFTDGRLEDWNVDDGDVWYLFDFDNGNGSEDEIVEWATLIADEQGILVSVDFVFDEYERETRYVGPGSSEAIIEEAAKHALGALLDLKKLLKQHDDYETGYDFAAIDAAAQDIISNFLK